MKNPVQKLCSLAAIFLVLFFALFVFNKDVMAVTLTVTSNADSGSGTLRDAVKRASPGDSIVFDPTVTTIVLTSGEILINKDLTIGGSGANQLRISGNGASRIFQISQNANVKLSGMTLESGRSADRGGAIFNNGNLLLNHVFMIKNFAITGGAVYSNGNLTIESSTIHGNRAQFGGGVSVSSSADQARFTNTTISGNFATSDDGGGLTVRSRLLFVNHCTIVNNRAAATYAAGGLQTFTTNAFVSNSIIWGNRSLQSNDVLGVINSQGFNLIGDPSGINGQWDETDLLSVNPLLGALQYNNGGTTPTFAPLVGSPVIDAGDESNTTNLDQTDAARLRGVNVDIGAVEFQPIAQQTIIVQNGNDSGVGSLREAVANSQSGGIIEFATNYVAPLSPITINKDLEIRGQGTNSLTIYGSDLGGVNAAQTFNISSGCKVRISGLKFSNFGVENHGALFLTDVIFTTPARRLPMIHAPLFSDAGSVTLNKSIIARSSVGGIEIQGGTLIMNNSSSLENFRYRSDGGGGIFFNGTFGKIKNSTIAQNRTGFIIYERGGGISVANGYLVLINSTIAENDSQSGLGGGIYVRAGAYASLTNCTITGNKSTFYDSGGIYSQSNVILKNTIVAGNSSRIGYPNNDIGGDVLSAGHNLIGQVGTSTGYVSTDLLNVNPLLLPLGNYGGATQTSALQPGSPAINAGDNFLAPPTDQRGAARFALGNRVDIGAYEYP